MMAAGLCILAYGMSLTGADAQVTLTFAGVNPSEGVILQVGSPLNIGPEGVYAGIYNQLVNGVATPSFCIDVSRDIAFGQTYTDYQYSDLSLSPLAPAGPMGSSAAVDIEKLWAAYYTDATGSSQDAAALQVAIWLEVAANVGYPLSVNGNNLSDPVYSEATTMLNSLPTLTAEASLVALVSPTGQNYVVPAGLNVVPEPSSIALAGLAGLVVLLRKRFK